VREYLGNEKWGEPRVIPNSATEEDPVAVGSPDGGYVFLKRPGMWWVAHFDAAGIQAPGPAHEWNGDLSVGEVCDRVLIVAQNEDGHLATNWLEPGTRFALRQGPILDFKSEVPVGFDRDPKSDLVVMVGAGRKPKQGALCMKVAWFKPRSETDWEKVEERWVGTADEAVHCSTRPVVRFGPDGRLLIFHTGWPDDSGEMTAWRTQMLPTRELHDGWLICLLYDVWTRTRCAVAWEIGPQGAVYAYRWDASGEKNKLQTAFNGLGIDTEPMRDFDDCALVSKWGIRQSILNMRR
jgi:hypothetical protein